MNIITWWLAYWWLIVIPGLFLMAGVAVYLDHRLAKRLRREQAAREEAEAHTPARHVRVFVPHADIKIVDDSVVVTAVSPHDPRKPGHDVMFTYDRDDQAAPSAEASPEPEAKQSSPGKPAARGQLFVAEPGATFPATGAELKGWTEVGTVIEGEMSVDFDYQDGWEIGFGDVVKSTTMTCTMKDISPVMMDFLRGEPLTLREDQHP